MKQLGEGNGFSVPIGYARRRVQFSKALRQASGEETSEQRSVVGTISGIQRQ